MCEYVTRLAYDELPNGFIVSTVHFDDIYETMVFRRGSWADLRCDRTTSRIEAEGNHADAIALYQYQGMEAV
jgi:hypothetical protein